MLYLILDFGDLGYFRSKKDVSRMHERKLVNICWALETNEFELKCCSGVCLSKRTEKNV